MFRQYTKTQAQNYLLGLLLADDLQSLKASRIFAGLEESVFLVAGKSVMQQAYVCLLEAEGWKVQLASEEQQQALSGFGALALAKRRGLTACG